MKQVYKMCYYLHKLQYIDVLRMKCEFAKDDNGTIWFVHASDIYVRMNVFKKDEDMLRQSRIQKLQQLKRE